MYTLEQTLRDQENLDCLCKDRALNTDELFDGSAFYGGSSIIREYSRYDEPLKAVLPHGPMLSNAFVWEAEANAPVPAVFYFSSNMREAYLRKSNKRLISGAAPILYAIEMCRDLPKAAKKGTIFFPGHSTHHWTSMMNFELLAEHLARLDREFQPVTVCIYWRDYLLGRHLVFQQHGLRLASAGHIFDPLFLWRFYHLCSMHKFASSNHYTSGTFYSVKSGCSFFFLKSFDCHWLGDQTNLSRDSERQYVRESTVHELETVFGTPQPSGKNRQVSLSDHYLGMDYFKSPQELRDQLICADKWDKRVFFVRDKNTPGKLVVPYYFQRGSHPHTIRWRKFLERGFDHLNAFASRFKGLNVFTSCRPNVKLSQEGIAFLNIGCGNSFSTEWTNLDFVGNEYVISHDLRTPLPFENNCFDAAYSSHLLEHMSPENGKRLVKEVHRVLKPGAVFRLAVPDLEEICREYIRQLEACLQDPSKTNIQRYKWIILELIDQMVREKTGGLMWDVLKSRDFDKCFVKKRTGDQFAEFFGNNSPKSADNKPETKSIPKHRSGISAILRNVFVTRKADKPKQLHDPRQSGEVHKWMYDRFSLKLLLEETGFISFSAKTFSESEIPYWEKYSLDRSTLGNYSRKPDSLYVESKKPD